jgi:hypothetical protein
MGRAGKQLARIGDDPSAQLYSRYRELTAKRDRESLVPTSPNTKN